MGLLPNGLFRRNLKIFRRSVKINFDVYLEDKRSALGGLGQDAKIFKMSCLRQICLWHDSQNAIRQQSLWETFLIIANLKKRANYPAYGGSAPRLKPCSMFKSHKNRPMVNKSTSRQYWQALPKTKNWMYKNIPLPIAPAPKSQVNRRRKGP